MSVVLEATRYDAEKHAYFRGEHELVSVTRLIGSVWPRTDGAPPDAIEGARMRGSWVDEQFMRWLGGSDIEIPAGTDQGWADALEQAISYWNTYRKGVKVECQVRLFGSHEAGTADLIVEGCEIIELKCTYEISKTVPAQLGGYLDLFSGSSQCSSPFQHTATRTEFDESREIKSGVLHCHKRLKKASFKAIGYLTAWDDWRTCRDFYRLVNRII